MKCTIHILIPDRPSPGLAKTALFESIFRRQSARNKNTKWQLPKRNVRTLLDREATDIPVGRTSLVAVELAKYTIDNAVPSETRFHVSGSLNDLGYTFYKSDKPNGERREARLCFAIKRDILTKATEMLHPVSDRIMTMRIPLTKDRNATIASAYAPTMAN